MHINMKRRFMHLMLIVMLLSPSWASGKNYDDYEDYGDYFNYDDDADETTESIETSTPHSAVPATMTTLELITQEIKKEAICPESCKCSVALDFVDCSNQNLMKIPQNLPYSTVHLNLSHNSLTELNVAALANCTDLRKITLNYNQIQRLTNTESFAKMPFLHNIDLSSNALHPLEGSEFVHARGLSKLLLTNNKFAVQPNISIVQAPNLKTLDLANCGIDQLSNNTFENLSSLVILNLENNPLGYSPLNTIAFKSLINLRTLNIPTVSKDMTYDLCKSIENIDIIHLTSEKHDISCFLLTSGSTYEESVIRTDLFKVATDPPSFADPSNNQDNSDENDDNNDFDEIIVVDGKHQTTHPIIQKLTSYEKMCIIYMLIAGLVVVLIVGLLGAFCVKGTHRLGREMWYRKQNYHKHYPYNLTVVNKNYENYLIENAEKQ